MYHLDDDKIQAVGLQVKDKSLYLGLPDSFSEGRNCDIYFGKEFSSIRTTDLEEMCIAWLALVNPDVLKFDD